MTTLSPNVGILASVNQTESQLLTPETQGDVHFQRMNKSDQSASNSEKLLTKTSEQRNFQFFHRIEIGDQNTDESSESSIEMVNLKDLILLDSERLEKHSLKFSNETTSENLSIPKHDFVGPLFSEIGPEDSLGRFENRSNEVDVTTLASNEVTSVIDFLTTFSDSNVKSHEISEAISEKMLKFAICLESLNCKKDDMRCEIYHSECNTGFNTKNISFQAQKKLSECSVNNILCQMDGEESCLETFERCIKIVIPEQHLHSINLEQGLEKAASGYSEEQKMNPFSMLLSLSKIPSLLGKNESSFLNNISKSTLDSIRKSIGEIQVLKNNSMENLGDWLLQNDTLTLFHDLIAIIPEKEVGDKKENASFIDFDLTNSTLFFNPASLAFGNVDKARRKVLSNDIITSLTEKKVNLCYSEDCNLDNTGAPFENAIEFQNQLTDCLEGTSCTTLCKTSQEKCIGRANVMKLSEENRKKLCQCVAEIMLCIKNNISNLESCGLGVDSCYEVLSLESEIDFNEILLASNKETIDKKEFIEDLAKNLTILTKEFSSSNITIQLPTNMLAHLDMEKFSYETDSETKSIFVYLNNSKISNWMKVVVETQDLEDESQFVRQKIIQKRIENGLNKFKGSGELPNGVQRSHPSVSMTTLTAFEETTSPIPSSFDGFLLKENNLFMIVSTTIANLVDKIAEKSEKIIVSLTKTEESFEPQFKIKMEMINKNLMVNLKTSKESLKSTIFQIYFKDIVASSTEAVNQDKLENLLEEKAIAASEQFKEIFSLEEMADIIISVLEFNSARVVDIEMRNHTLTLKVDKNDYYLGLKDPFQSEKLVQFNISNYLLEAKDLIIQTLQKNLKKQPQEEVLYDSAEENNSFDTLNDSVKDISKEKTLIGTERNEESLSNISDYDEDLTELTLNMKQTTTLKTLENDENLSNETLVKGQGFTVDPVIEMLIEVAKNDSRSEWLGGQATTPFFNSLESSGIQRYCLSFI